MRQILSVGFLLIAILCLGGCASTDPGSDSHASVQVQDTTLAAIQEVSAAVFTEKGYTVNARQRDLMVFDRIGSRSDQLKWGGWDGSGVTMRVKMAIRDLGTGTSFILQADSYNVRDASDPFFSENRNIMLNHRPYQKLLDEVKSRLAKKT